MDVIEMQKKAGEASTLLAAMANEKRLMLLCQLIEGEKSVTELSEALGVRQPTVSQHLALLRKDGFVEPRRDGQVQYYGIASEEVRSILSTLYSIYCVPTPQQEAAKKAVQKVVQKAAQSAPRKAESR
jgi:DNA-binding transcriptional ArsR family regulator